MSAGLATSVADSMLTLLPDVVYLQRHEGDPGAFGTMNASRASRRLPAVLMPACEGARWLGCSVAWPGQAHDEIVTHVSVWTESVGGGFITSVELDEPAVVGIGEGFAFDSYAIALGPIARVEAEKGTH